MAERRTTSNRSGSSEVIAGSRKKNPNQRTREFGGWSSNPRYGDPSEKTPSRRRGNFDDPQPHGKKWDPADIAAEKKRAKKRRANKWKPDNSSPADDLRRAASGLGSIGKAVLSKLFGRSEDKIDKAVNRFANSEHAGFERGKEMSGKAVEKLITEIKDGDDEDSNSSSAGEVTAPPVASSTMTPKERKKAEQDYTDFLDSQKADPDAYKSLFERDESVAGVSLFDRPYEADTVYAQTDTSSTPAVKPEGPLGREGSPTRKLAPGDGVRKAGPGTQHPMANLAARGNDTSFNTESRTPTFTPESIRTESARPSSTLRQEKRPLTKVEAARERMFSEEQDSPAPLFSEEQDSGTSYDTASEWSDEQIGEIQQLLSKGSLPDFARELLSKALKGVGSNRQHGASPRTMAR